MAFLSNVNAVLKFLANFIKGSLIATYYFIKAVLLFFVPKCFLFKDVSNETVLITGGASGLGRLLALRMAKLGATVVIWDLNTTGLEETTKMVEEMRSKKDKVGKCYHYQVDISDRFKVYVAAERVKREVGDVTMLINNAGVVTGKRFLECTDEKIIKTFEVNALAHFWVSLIQTKHFSIFCFSTSPQLVNNLLNILISERVRQMDERAMLIFKHKTQRLIKFTGRDVGLPRRILSRRCR